MHWVVRQQVGRYLERGVSADLKLLSNVLKRWEGRSHFLYVWRLFMLCSPPLDGQSVYNWIQRKRCDGKRYEEDE